MSELSQIYGLFDAKDIINVGKNEYNEGYRQCNIDAINEINKTEDTLVSLFKKEKDIWTIRMAFAELREQLKENYNE